MRWHYVLNKVGILVVFLSVTMVIPMCFSIYYDDIFLPYLKSIVITVFFGGIFCIFFKRRSLDNISQREGIAIVAIGWTLVSFFGAFPFYFSTKEFVFIDAFFESISGFTTTGASILVDIESQPKGLLLWRSLIQWLGGIGIIVLSIAILPLIGVDGGRLYKAEVPSPVPDKLKPRIRETAVILWKVYAMFSIIELILLMISGMCFFDALCHSFTTMPTGGFSTLNFSVGQFDNVYIEVIILVFMIFAGINFSLHYQMLKGDRLVFWKNSECRFFLSFCVILIFIVTFNLYGTVYDTVSESFRYASFQVVSIITTTGFIVVDYELWPDMSQLIILGCMFVGASAGSTSGGMKCLRLILCFKYCYKELFSLIHPRAITHIKISGKLIPEQIIKNVLGFLALYIILFVVSVILLSAVGVDFVTSIGAIASSMGNIGPGFGMVGPVENYSSIPFCGKCILSWCMLLGRLEIYTLIVLVVPEFWKA